MRILVRAYSYFLFVIKNSRRWCLKKSVLNNKFKIKTPLFHLVLYQHGEENAPKSTVGFAFLSAAGSRWLQWDGGSWLGDEMGPRTSEFVSQWVCGWVLERDVWYSCSPASHLGCSLYSCGEFEQRRHTRQRCFLGSVMWCATQWHLCEKFLASDTRQNRRQDCAWSLVKCDGKRPGSGVKSTWD